MHDAVARTRRAVALAIICSSAIGAVGAHVALAASNTRSLAKSAKRIRHARRHARRFAAHASSIPGPVGIPGTWNVAFDDEFNATSLDTTIWQAGWFGSGTTSPVNSLEQACYSSSNVTFPGDGTVHLKVTNAPSSCGGVTRPYTGALL